MSKQTWIIGFAAVFFLLWTGIACATPFGQNITISDKNSDSSNSWYKDREDNEVEPNMVRHQKWDLEGMFVDDAFSLSLVGGYDFKNGAPSHYGQLMSGDIFVDVNGDAVYGDYHGKEIGNREVKSAFGYDYVFQLTFDVKDNHTYSLYALNENSTTKTSYEKQNQGSNPWRYKDTGEKALATGQFEYNQLGENLVGALGFQGVGHYAISGFDLNLIPAGFEQINLHFTMECGNDNLMGQATAPVPEPGTMVLLGTGLIGLGAVGRRKRKKSV